MELNQELKFLYVKTQKPNERLYRIHLWCASSWQNSWHIIQASTDNKLWQMESHYNHLNKKLDGLQDKQRRKWFPSSSCSKAVYKPVWHTPLLSVQWINSWWLTEELSETCRVSCQNKFVKLVHLVGFIMKKW